MSLWRKDPKLPGFDPQPPVEPRWTVGMIAGYCVSVLNQWSNDDHRENTDHGFGVLADRMQGGERMRCGKCWGLSDYFNHFMSRDEAFLQGLAFTRLHMHFPPKPLTKDEKEKVLVTMKHRRGAWRLTSW